VAATPAVEAVAATSDACTFCHGGEHWATTAYNKSGWFKCPRCGGTGIEPERPLIHSSLLLRNVRSGKVWAVFGWYEGMRHPDGTVERAAGDWGIHRMKPSRLGSWYVWQIIHRTTEQLLDTRRWIPVGFGDAWDHVKMESDPLPT
jgi:hypothetical protein